MAELMNIANYTIGEGYPCFIIAEAGVNHNGSLELAKKLVDAAVRAKADAVKFQTFKTEDLILEDIAKASYQKVTTSAGETQTEMLRKLEINKEFHVELIKYCRTKNILFMSTCYEEASLNLLIELGLGAIKIASTDTTNLLFLEKVARTGKPVILSTGMCTLLEIKQAYQCLKDYGAKQIALLKCTSNYPTDVKDVHLKAMLTFEEQFDAVIGFSDHTPGVGASPYAVALGAKIVEKHFTLDKSLPGPDHQASLSTDELTLWVKEIRRVEAMLGEKEIQPTLSEKETKKSLQKCLVPRTDLKKGDRITRENIIAKRTGGEGIGACEVYSTIGMRLINDVSSKQPLCWSDLEK